MSQHARSRALIGSGALALVVTSPVGAAGPARGKGGDSVQASAACTHGGLMRLKAKRDNGRIEVEPEADSNRGRQTWSCSDRPRS